MAGKKQAPVELYDVCSAVTGALVVIGVPLDVAFEEKARLNAEARFPNPERKSSRWPSGEPCGMQAGVVTTYCVKSKSGIEA